MPKPTNQSIAAGYRKDVVEKQGDNLKDETWYGVWCGYVIGRGRPDMADYEIYMSTGFPEEQ